MEKKNTSSNGDKPATILESSVDIENYDILVIGRTGMGKSSTVDKLMVPNTYIQGTQLITSHPSQSERKDTACPEQDDVSQLERREAAGSEADGDTPIIDSTGKAQYKNLTARVASKDPMKHVNAGQRLKNVDFCSNLEEPHNEIDKLRNDEKLKESVYSSTTCCELLTNTDSKIRVLDTPGFFSAYIDGDTSRNTTYNNLVTVRHIIRIQAAEELSFKRVLYFLPQSGPLTRADRIVQQEIQSMVKFFGTTIFRCMVLIGTMTPHISIMSEMSSEVKFPQDRLEESRQCFQEALVREFKERNRTEDLKRLPEPPIIFLEMTDTCEKILEKVKNAPVTDRNYSLGFNSKTCCKCNIELSTNHAICEYRTAGEKPWADPLPYEDSSCHPKILPVHTPGSVTLGILKILMFKWQFTEEQCVHCEKGPGSPGCLKVNDKFEYKNEIITVQHSSQIDN